MVTLRNARLYPLTGNISQDMRKKFFYFGNRIYQIYVRCQLLVTVTLKEM